jgi:hypothetical protein
MAEAFYICQLNNLCLQTVLSAHSALKCFFGAVTNSRAPVLVSRPLLRLPTPHLWPRRLDSLWERAGNNHDPSLTVPAAAQSQRGFRGGCDHRGALSDAIRGRSADDQ